MEKTEWDMSWDGLNISFNMIFLTRFFLTITFKNHSSKNRYSLTYDHTWAQYYGFRLCQSLSRSTCGCAWFCYFFAAIVEWITIVKWTQWSLSKSIVCNGWFCQKLKTNASFGQKMWSIVVTWLQDAKNCCKCRPVAQCPKCNHVTMGWGGGTGTFTRL